MESIITDAHEQFVQCRSEKNWLFFGNERGGKTGVIIYSILQGAKFHGLNEYEYHFDILNHLADRSTEKALYDLLPNRWKK